MHKHTCSTEFLFHVDFGAIGSGCSSFANALDRIDWPNVKPLLNAVNRIKNIFKPVFNFLGKINGVLNKKICVPDPIELAAEKVKETSREILRRIRVRIRLRRWGKRRRRSISKIDDVTIPESEAKSFLIEKRAKQVCFT